MKFVIEVCDPFEAGMRQLQRGIVFTTDAACGLGDAEVTKLPSRDRGLFLDAAEGREHAGRFHHVGEQFTQLGRLTLGSAHAWN